MQVCHLVYRKLYPVLNTVPDFLIFLCTANFNLFEDSEAINALPAACRAEIWDAISGKVGFSCNGNFLPKKFGKFVLRPKTNYAELNPLLLINAFLAPSAHDSAISQSQLV